MIIITGATGALNGATVDHLLRRVPAEEITVVVRDPAKARYLADRGVAVRHGDYEDPRSLPAAFDGADQLLLVSSNSLDSNVVLGQHTAAIDAALTAGVGRILYTSHQGSAIDTPFGPGRDHAATEHLLSESGLAWTSLRNGFYAHSLNWVLGPWRETGVIAVPADGPVSWTARDDAAEAAAVILASDIVYDGATTLTASAAPTFADIAKIASEIAGREVSFEVIGDEAWLAAQHEQAMGRLLLGMFHAAHRGYFAGVDPLLRGLLGREPQTVRDLLADSMISDPQPIKRD